MYPNYQNNNDATPNKQLIYPELQLIIKSIMESTNSKSQLDNVMELGNLLTSQFKGWTYETTRN